MHFIMVINQAELENLIKRIIELTLKLQDENKESNLLVLAGSDIDHLKKALNCYEFENNVEYTIAVNEVQMENKELGELICSKGCNIVNISKALNSQINYSKIIYLTMPRDILAKCALCISDVYETKLMKKAFEKSLNVVIAKNALEPFVGTEPESYKKRVLWYVRVLLEYGVQIELNS